MKAVGWTKISKVAVALWAHRIAFETGAIELPEVDAVALPAGSPTVATVYHDFILLVRCRWADEPGAPVAFGRAWAASWCGVTEDEARAAIDELRRLGLIREVGKKGRSREWLPKTRTRP
jgi:hypothetical protein